jgi:ribosomal protein L32
MPNPKHRHSKTRRDLRRAHDFLKPKQTSNCPNCGTEKLPSPRVRVLRLVQGARSHDRGHEVA